MLGFDNQIVDYCNNERYIYTRYADDILISKNTAFEDEEYKRLDEVIDGFLKIINLKINAKKKKKLFLEKDGQHIKYIGVNIVHFEKGNRLSVGRQYVNDVVKEYYRYLEELEHLEENNNKMKEHLFYQERKIAGRVSFIKVVEGQEGWEKIKRRLGRTDMLIANEKLLLDNIMITNNL